MSERTTAPYGSWPSPLAATDIAAAATPYADLAADDNSVYWLQGDPALGGRLAVMRWSDGEVIQLTPNNFNARTAVHEYGGGALGAGAGIVLATSWVDQRVYRVDVDAPQPVTPEPKSPSGLRWADMAPLPGGQEFVAIRESHGADRPRANTNIHGEDEAVNEIVLVDLRTGSQQVLISGSDFVGAVRVNPAGNRLAWLQWNHPDMPWDAAELWVGDLADDGITGAHRIAGGRHDGSVSSVCDAIWDGDDRLVFSDDPSGWWNVYAWDGSIKRLHDAEVDVGFPRWIHGTHALAISGPGGDEYSIVYESGFGRVTRVGDGKRVTPDDLTFITSLVATPSGLVVMAGGPRTPSGIFLLPNDTTGAPGTRRLSAEPDPEDVPTVTAMPQAIEFPTGDDAVAYGLYYPPASDTHVGPDDERPPLIVLTHGGPTAAARTSINPTAQYWATRGFAVVDVNYRGSSPGFGRAFRDALQGNWGIHDVADCIAATDYLVAADKVDPQRLIIEGGSAGGYTTLLILCTTDHFAAGGSSYGVSDLTGLAKHTHKFESRYLDGLIGAWPDEEAMYIERSPITHVDRLKTPMIVLQGDEDKVVPPKQSEVIVEALKSKGIPHAYLLFKGEQHGFRQAAHIARALEARLAFYGITLGFTPADKITLPEYQPARN